jgi:hypothetical protein
MSDQTVNDFTLVYGAINSQFPELTDGITKSIATARILKAYQDVDTIMDCLKDNAFVVTYYNKAMSDFATSRSSGISNSILYNGKIKRECVGDRFDLQHNKRNITGLMNDY